VASIERNGRHGREVNLSGAVTVAVLSPRNSLQSTMNEQIGPDQKVLLDELHAAYLGRRPPGFERHRIEAWARAIRHAYHCGQLDVAEHAVRCLLQSHPTLQFARTMSELFDRLPPADGSQTEFSDDPEKDVQVAARPGADLAILLFCGGADMLGLPLSMIHGWLGRLPASLIYLRDFQRSRYLNGVPSLGPDLETTLVNLRRLIGSLGASRIACYGNSGGVFPALYYGCNLGAKAVLGVAGKTNHTPEFNVHSPVKAKYANFARDYARFELDARVVFEATQSPPRVCMIYGQNNWDDRRHAEHMGALNGVTLWPVENFSGHDAVMQLITRDEYPRALAWLISACARD